MCENFTDSRLQDMALSEKDTNSVLNCNEVNISMNEVLDWNSDFCESPRQLFLLNWSWRMLLKIV